MLCKHCFSRPSPEGYHVCGEVDHKRKYCLLKTEPRQLSSRKDKIKRRKRGSGIDQSVKDLKRPPNKKKKMIKYHANYITENNFLSIFLAYVH